MSASTEEFLEHFGTKGMKWGVRRKRGPDGRVGGESSNTSSNKEKANSGQKGGKSSSKSIGKKTKVSKLSDEQLKAAVNRMQMEKQYNQLSAERNVAAKTRGQKFTEFVMSSAADIAKSQSKRAANAYVGKVIDDSLKKAGITPQKKKKKKK